MAANTFKGHVLSGTTAARPAATTVPVGTLYASSSDGTIYQSDGTTWNTWLAAPAGGGVTVDSYVQATVGVAISATVEASSTTIVTAAAVTASGSITYCVEFFCSDVQLNVANNWVLFNLFDGSTQIGRVASASCSGTGMIWEGPVLARRYLMPAAGSHAYSIRAWRSSAGNVIAQAGDGTGTNTAPMYIRVTHGG